MHVERTAVGKAIRTIGSRLFAHGNGSALGPADEFSRHGETFDTMRDFMHGNAIAPTPDNYALVYRYRVTGEPDLEDAIDSLISTGHVPGADQSPEEELHQILQTAQKNLDEVEVLVRKSGRDTKGFGDALELQLASNPAIGALIGLTRTMMERTRTAEEELRLRGQAMTNLQMSLAEARVRADTDALTGLNNRRAFERHLGAAGARASMSGRPLALAICDIDLFKTINDTHGHCTGDRVLQFVSGLLKDGCGRRANVSRHGGEEFVVVFEETSADQAYEIIDAIRRDLKSRHLINRETGQPLGEISFSAGVGQLGSGGDVGSMLRAADRALYKAKAAGRDQVIIAGA